MTDIQKPILKRLPKNTTPKKKLFSYVLSDDIEFLHFTLRIFVSCGKYFLQNGFIGIQKSFEFLAFLRSRDIRNADFSLKLFQEFVDVFDHFIFIIVENLFDFSHAVVGFPDIVHRHGTVFVVVSFGKNHNIPIVEK